MNKQKTALLIFVLILIGFVFVVVNSTKISDRLSGVDNDASEQGLSEEDPIFIVADESETGISMEYDWLQENGCPNNGGVIDVTNQDLIFSDNDVPFDVLTAKCADNSTKLYYFEISSFFGKW